MRTPPPVRKLPAYPVTGGVALLAIAVSLGWWTHNFGIEALEMNGLAWHGQPWRLLTSVLPHVNVMHLFFDVAWFWSFGTLIEDILGKLFLTGLIVVLAIGSAAAEFAFFSGGVGLSGVGYGLFGFLWVLSRRDRRFAGAVDQKTVQLFVAWFFLCIVMTVVKILPVANVAHGAGALLGAGIAYAFVSKGRPRLAAATALIVLLAGTLALASVFRPVVNLSEDGAHDDVNLGYGALVAHNDEAALKHLRRAVAYRHADAIAWYDFGIACERTGRRAEAADAYRHALVLNPTSADYKEALQQLMQS